MTVHAPTERRADLRLTVVIPVFDERFLAGDLLERVLAEEVPGIARLDVVVVDDGSRDGSDAILQEVADRHPARVRYVRHSTNQGKGAALATGVRHADGDLILFQDADLEYDPADYAELVRPFLEDGADAVFGSRFLPSRRRRTVYFRLSLANRLLTLVSNVFTNLNVSDLRCGLKVFRAPLLRSIPIRSRGFAVDVELAAKLAKRSARVFEVPTSYLARTYQEGKKVRAPDWVKMLVAILRYWLIDDLYAEDEYGSHILHELEKAQRFNGWLADAIRPHVGRRVLEIGAGIGNITLWMLPRERYVASDINPHYLDYLANFAMGKPYLETDRIDLTDPACFERWHGQFDTVVCLNVLEHVDDPIGALRNIRGALGDGGQAVLYVPQGQQLYSSLDRVLGHHCRYDPERLARELAEADLELVSWRHFNRCSVPGWWWNGVVRKRTDFSRIQLKVFNALVPLLKRVDPWIPWAGLGVIAVARPR